MSEVTAEQLAEKVGMPVDKLLKRFAEAGVSVSAANQVVSDDEKMRLLNHLKNLHGEEAEADGGMAVPERITLKRKKVKELKLSSASGRGKTVNVEVRKKRTYVKRSVIAEQQAAEEAAKAEELAKQQAAEQAQREAEAAANQTVVADAPVTEAAEAAPKKKTKTDKKRKDEDDPKPKGKPRVEPALEELVLTDDSGSVVADTPPSEDVSLASKSSGRRKKKKEKRSHQATQAIKQEFSKPTAPIVRDVIIPETVTVGDLAQKMSMKAAEVIKAMMGMGMMATINQVIDQDTAVLVVEELGHTAKPLKENAVEEALAEVLAGSEAEQVHRPPVVTIMGHVDHGKTSLLDYVRTSKVTSTEAGGITQHIGAYHVETDRGVITFLDTPGHAAFTAMRARGAKATDIVILVVAADDGVKPQTIEAIQHAKAGGVPLIVAVNKIDKPEADPDRVKTELSNHEVIPEDWGGDTMFVPISAKTGENVDSLLDSILVQAEMLELTAPVDCPARGVVVESRLDKGRGAVATVLVQSGTLRQGDVLLAGLEYGRVRALLDENGKRVQEAGPSIPVEVLGLSGTPRAGDETTVVTDERKAREVALFRQGKFRDVKLARQKAASLENLFQQTKLGDVTNLNIILKADVQGSAEALSESLLKLSTEEVRVNIVATGIGGITESDANLAVASQAIIIGFNVRADAGAKRIINGEGIDLHYYNVIYNAIDEIKLAITGMLSPEFQEKIVGLAQVREVFRSSKIGAIAGCMVIEGLLKRNLPIRVLRDNVVIFEGELESLRRFKEDVNEVRNGMECGIAVKDYNDVKEGDQIEVYEKVTVARVHPSSV